MPGASRAVLLWSLWIGASLVVDLAAWAALHTIPVLAADPPGSAGAIALIWVHGFILPPLFAGGNRRASRLALGSGVALVAVPVALVLAIAAGFLVLNTSLLAIIALSPPQDDYVARHETGLFLQPVFGIREGVMSTVPGVGGAVAALSAGGAAAAIPPLCRPRLSWRVALAGAWSATVLFMPEWWPPWLDGAWRTPALLFGAALPPLILVSWRGYSTAGPASPSASAYRGTESSDTAALVGRRSSAPISLSDPSS